MFPGLALGARLGDLLFTLQMLMLDALIMQMMMLLVRLNASSIDLYGGLKIKADAHEARHGQTLTAGSLRKK